MAAITPRRSARLPHQHTPKMSERKKGLFQSESETSRESLTKHRQLTVLDSESESDDCDLGIMGTLDSSSCDENDSNLPKTPERKVWLGTTRSQSKKLLKESHDLKNFIKSPFTLTKFQTRYSCADSKCTGSLSTPVTPHLQNHPSTPSSTHSCASVHTTSSTSSRARKSLASLIADTESCSSSLKDLNFDSDSGADSKENTPSKSFRRSSRRQKLTPKLQSFKGILMEQKKNTTPMKYPVVCLTKMDMSSIVSPTQMLKTPHNTSESNISPPKLSHNRRSVVQIDESPESACDSEKSHKRLNYDSKSDNGPNSKHPRLDTSTAPKARLSLFNSDRLKEILSAKSFYGKSNPDLNTAVATKISSAIEATQSHRRRLFPQSHSNKRKRKPGQINLGVRHRIRKPKVHKNKLASLRSAMEANVSSGSAMNSTASSGTLNNTMISQNDSSMLSQDTSQELDKADPFDKEKQTIEALLSQWTEEEVPESELKKPELPCFSKTVIEETNQIFQPVTAVPVSIQNIPQDTEAVIVELGAQKTELETNETGHSMGLSDVVMAEPGHKDNHGGLPKGDFLPVEGGYILVGDSVAPPAQEELPDLDEIERELRMLDEQILQMAQSNNMDAHAVLASTETAPVTTESPSTPTAGDGSIKPHKLFPIFSKPNPGTPTTPTAKGTSDKGKKPLLRTGKDQYVIDAGQKKFGATQCAECGVIYQIGDPQDEHDHLVHHNATDVLKFNGVKDECVVGTSGSARCVRIRGGEPGWRKVEALLDRVVHPHLGYGSGLPRDQVELYTAYLYIDKKQIVGCLVVEPKLRAYKLIPGEPDCCSVEDYPVKCGVSRIWTHISYRRRGLASRLLECARASFLYGAALRVDHIAFSAPTAAGKALATAYCGTPNFYVYID
ncbi:N-acetyltransferase ESCO2 [Pectinophora gossypiella]|uniref:N-acetyltransferase ESCO2 n=1 Tax=Pectinophora gossypiella TaxID=13191 RepID=UPI00214F0B76|nr:N-acetyltransferase ESCO2 [Pectinophora gossypiella]